MSEKFAGLNVIQILKKKYKCKIGYSDHTLNHASGIIAAYLGVEYIENILQLQKNFMVVMQNFHGTRRF